MQDSEDGKAPRKVPARDAKIEGFIDALRGMADQADEAQMPAYAHILDEAFKRCLLHYVSEKKAALDEALSKDGPGPSTIN